jgi:hypothetical protein
MTYLLSMVLVFATVLGGVFGEATATATPAGGGRLSVEFTVQVAGDANAVVAHIVDIGGDQSVTSLAARGAGEWGGSTVTDASNLVVVFEAIRPDDSSDMSDPATLATLGVDPTLLGIEGSGTTRAPAEGYSKRTLRWGWGALALTAWALALLAFWAAGGGERRSEPSKEPETGEHEEEPATTVPEPSPPAPETPGDSEE